MGGGIIASNTNAVGASLAAVLRNDGIPWIRKAYLVRLNFSILSLILFASANGYDGSMMNGLQALDQWQDFMNHPTGAWLGFINAAQSLGAIFVYPLVAWVCARFGRKMGVGGGYLWLLLGVGLQTGARNSTMFVLGRLFLGGVSAHFAVTAPCLITEIAYPTHRGVVTALYNTGWYIGSLIAAWATFGTRDYTTSWAWRTPSILQLLVPAVALIGFLLAPESPRWYASQGRHDEARAVLVKYHAGGDESSPLVAYELEEIETTLRLERESKTETSYLDMFKTPGNRHRLFISLTLGIAAQWNGVGVVSYYLSLVLKTAGITSVTNQTLLNGCLQIWNLIIAVGAAFFVNKAGRRKLFIISCTGMLVSYILITALSGSFAATNHTSTGLAIIPMLFLYYGFYDIAFTPLLVGYTAEIWPYILRARGLTVTLISTQLAVFFNIFVNPIALEAIDWKYYIVFVVLLVIITAICYFAYPETRGRSLEEMARIFDKESAAVPTPGSILHHLDENPDIKKRMTEPPVHREYLEENEESKLEV